MSKHWVSVNPPSPPPLSPFQQIFMSQHLPDSFPLSLLSFREDGASQSARDKKRPIIAYTQTACLLALLAAYPVVCLQLRDKAMKVSDTRGFGCRTWRLSPSCKTSSPDVISVVGDINMFIQPLLILYTLQFVLLGLESSAIITACYAMSTGAWGQVTGIRALALGKSGRKASWRGACNSLHQLSSARSRAQRSSDEFLPLSLFPSCHLNVSYSHVNVVIFIRSSKALNPLHQQARNWPLPFLSMINWLASDPATFFSRASDFPKNQRFSDLRCRRAGMNGYLAISLP